MLYPTLSKWPLWRLRALARIAKTRARGFFSDPRNMIDLRRALELAEAAPPKLEDVPAILKRLPPR